MSKELHIISVTPGDLYFYWSTKVWLTNLRKYNYSNKARVLVFNDYAHLLTGVHPRWKELESEFPEARFFYYNDHENILERFIAPYDYIPLLRPHVLKRHFIEYPELSKCAIYYCDSDTCFMREPTFLKELKDDDVNYLSYTGNRTIDYNYMNVTYLDKKINDVRSEMVEQYKEIDVVQGLADIFGLTRGKLEQENNNFGGAQYLLKNIDSSFWEAVFNGCIYVKRYLGAINRRYFESEDRGFQSWCADMWSIQLNLWRLRLPSVTPPEMDFIWATDDISKWGTQIIFHDAGAGKGSIRYIDGSENFLFFKRKHDYINNLYTPFEDDLSFVSDKYCSYMYVQEILAAKTKKETALLTP